MRHAAIMIYWERGITIGFLILPDGAKARSSIQSHSLYCCFRWFLNGLFTTSSTCSSEVIPLSMTIRSMLMEQMVPAAFISGVKSLLNAFKTNISCFLKSTPGLRFHTTNNQYFVSSLVMQLLGGHLTKIPLGSCSLGTVLWFSITMVATRCHLLIPPTWQLHASFYNLIFELWYILPRHWLYNWMTYQNTMAFHWHFLSGSGDNCSFYWVQHVL